MWRHLNSALKDSVSSLVQELHQLSHEEEQEQEQEEEEAVLEYKALLAEQNKVIEALRKELEVARASIGEREHQEVLNEEKGEQQHQEQDQDQDQRKQDHQEYEQQDHQEKEQQEHDDIGGGGGGKVPESVEKELQLARERCGNAEEALKREKEKISDLMQEVQDLKRRENALVSNGKAQEKQYQTMIEQFRKLQQECKEAFGKEEEVSREIVKAQIEATQSKEKVRMLEVELQESQARNDSLGRKLELLKEESSAKQALVDGLTGQLEQRIAEAMQNENALLDDINRLETELEESAIRFTDAVENSKLREQELLSEIGSLKNEINSLREHVNNMEANADISSAVVEEHKKLLTEFEEKCQQNIKIQDALANLQSVLELFQQDFEKEKKQLVHQVNDANRKLEEFESASKEVEELRSEIKSRDEHIINLRDELRSFRKYASNLESDNAELRQRMQQTLARLENFSADEHLVDRRLVNQLLVAYVEGKRSRSEVLNLMANILQFSEEERTKIGLGTSNHNSSLLSTVVSMIAPRAIDESKFPLETSKNLADLWIDFLLDESTAKISTNLSRPAELVELSERSDSLHEHSESVEVNESNL